MDNSRNTAGPAAGSVASELGIRPLNARSVVLSALLGTHPPELPVAALVALAAAFGMAPGTLRTALSRMAANGEVASTEGRYRLVGRMIERQREQDEGRSSAGAAWDCTWWSATVDGGRRPATERRRLRSAMLGARLGELRPGVWMRPANIDVCVERADAVVVRGELAEGDPERLAARLWDLDASERRAAQLRGALDRWTAALATGGDSAIAPAFTAFAACLQFLRTEPQLPIELAASPAALALRARYGRAEPVLHDRLRTIYRRPPGSFPT